MGHIKSSTAGKLFTQNNYEKFLIDEIGKLFTQNNYEKFLIDAKDFLYNIIKKGDENEIFSDEFARHNIALNFLSNLNFNIMLGFGPGEEHFNSSELDKFLEFLIDFSSVVHKTTCMIIQEWEIHMRKNKL